MAQFSFDVVSTYDKAELNNVHSAAVRDIGNRYDFKNTPAGIEWLDDKKGFIISGNGDWQIESIIDIIRKHLIARGQSPKTLDLTQAVREAHLKTTKNVPFVDGLDQDKAKAITALIRDSHPKAKPQIQGDTVRVSSTSKDELQAVMQTLRQADLPYPVSYINFR